MVAAMKTLLNELLNEHVAPVLLNKAYRLLNHRPTVLVSAAHGGVRNAMAAAWSCALDFQPPKVTVVLDKATRTRELVEASGFFVLQVPTAAQAELTHRLGNRSLHQDADKSPTRGRGWWMSTSRPMRASAPTAPPRVRPLVDGCAAWLVPGLARAPQPVDLRPVHRRGRRGLG